MLQNYKKATLGGILLWVLIFVTWSIIIFLPPFKDGANMMWQYIIHYVLLILWIWIVAKMYFGKAKASLKEGIMAGIYFLIIGAILDLIITVPLFIEGDYTGFFGQWEMWIAYVELIVLMAIFGAIMTKKSDNKEVTAPEAAQSASQPMADTETPPSSPPADDLEKDKIEY